MVKAEDIPVETTKTTAPKETPTEENGDEKQYLQQMDFILRNGKVRDDRTGTGTIGLFGMQARYSLRDGTMPLVTTKRVFWKGIVEELLWFISGDTNAKNLSAKGVKIWEANGSRAFLDSLGFTDREEGDLGPVYGFQWRHCGAEYKDCHTDYSGKGIDQLTNVIRMIKEDPDSRRIMITAWNPLDLDKMALPPCHTLCQFYVSDGELSCQLYQRSGDMGLGVPFNIASYGLLTHMIAHVTGLKAGDFIHSLGDAHIYTNHVDAVKVQLERKPRAFPKIRFADGIHSIDDFTAEKIFLEGYDPHPTIKMEMSA
ncbi:hypothetical protein QR680_012687 [Steinernema hermaphroditum]|uniref:Thymidylate synthase n=1 Tax=Steinernema hermaphroditum TaxID=289476 RepID=A0AA39I548_9BILA|nr:hypothetical protein QR680_012687 [Steinernema hermaphroditum]